MKKTTKQIVLNELRILGLWILICFALAMLLVFGSSFKLLSESHVNFFAAFLPLGLIAYIPYLIIKILVLVLSKERIVESGREYSVTELRRSQIGGWLILFVFTNGLGGLLNSLKFFTEFNAAIAIRPQSIFTGYLALDALAMITMGIFQLIAVYQIFKLKPGAVKTVNQMLRFTIIASGISAAICLLLVSNDIVHSNAAISRFVINRVMAVFMALIWLLYFKKSKRVSQTFPSDPVGFH